MNAKLMEEYLPDSSMESGNKCPECELSLFATKKENGRLHCYKCGLDFVACVGCGELSAPDDPEPFTICRECGDDKDDDKNGVATCHDCGGEVSRIFDKAPDGKWYERSARCTKCRREF